MKVLLHCTIDQYNEKLYKIWKKWPKRNFFMKSDLIENFEKKWLKREKNFFKWSYSKIFLKSDYIEIFEKNDYIEIFMKKVII